MDSPNNADPYFAFMFAVDSASAPAAIAVPDSVGIRAGRKSIA